MFRQFVRRYTTSTLERDIQREYRRITYPFILIPTTTVLGCINGAYGSPSSDRNEIADNASDGAKSGFGAGVGISLLALFPIPLIPISMLIIIVTLMPDGVAYLETKRRKIFNPTKID